jgi:hypothetical protein
MDWEIRHLPTIFITGNTWNPHEDDIYPSGSSHESMEMQMVQSLTSGMMQRQVHSLWANEAKATVDLHGEVEHELENTSPVYNVWSFCKCMLGAVNGVTTYCKDINEKLNASSIITNDRHSKVTPEELWRKWNIGLQIPRTLYRPQATQYGIQMAIHPMTKRLHIFKSTKTSGDMVCWHSHFQSQIEARQSLHQCLHSGQVYLSHTNVFESQRW